jgi:hypothetical protein
MKSNLEKQLGASRDEAERLVRAEHGDDALEIICSFSELDCYADVKLEGEWVRYTLIHNGDDEDCELRRIS